MENPVCVFARVCVFLNHLWITPIKTTPHRGASEVGPATTKDNNYSAKMIQPVAREITNGAVFMVCSAFV
ncbi:uncharacterized protein LOC122620307 isoform X2 [Drosophila teissieri]|uniref:uncharacterized protein LOC122620307 isoform X2 n=1 Tax=Drosophila teissieri TaxID=7243 RepID=UPI001CBA03CD|nr:uncharacterized protein LOC122620307 isoform X2 [Drosophila teissieri]